MRKRSAMETERQTYIRLLSEASASGPKMAGEERDAALCGELIEGGYLDGDVIRDQDGCIVGSVVVGVTVQGRLFVLKMRQEEREASLRHKSLGYILILVGYIFGFLSPVLSDWLKALLK